MTEAAQELLDRMCNMHKEEVILQLLADSPISKNDLAKMKQIIDQKKRLPLKRSHATVYQEKSIYAKGRKTKWVFHKLLH